MIKLQVPYKNKHIDEIAIDNNFRILKSSMINYTLDLTDYDLSIEYIEYLEQMQKLSINNEKLKKIFNVNCLYVLKNIVYDNLIKLKKIYNEAKIYMI
jgi:hypothetical protein